MSAAAGAPLRVVIVDDEPLARLRLRQLLGSPDNPPVEVVGEAADAIDALALVERGACDLLLLDIRLPGRDGLRLAEGLRALPAPPAVVFVTAHAEHALRAFELEAVDYLTKPVRRDRLAMALARVAQRRLAAAPVAAAPAPVLVVNDRGRVLRLPATEILYLKAELKYVTVVSQQGRWLLDEPLAELEQQLGAGFLRVHRNAVVALAAVRALARRPLEAQDAPAPRDDAAAPRAADIAATAPQPEPSPDAVWHVQLANGDWLQVSRRQVPLVRDVLGRSPPQAR